MTDQFDLFDTKATASASDGANRRAMLRHKTNWPALCYADGLQAAVTVTDVSDGGLGIDGDIPFVQDQLVRIDLHGVGTYMCRVAWIARGRGGLEFVREDHELSDDAVAGLAAQIVSLGGK